MGGQAVGSFNVIAHLVMLGWFPLCFGLFLLTKPARAVAIGLVTGLLLLPNIQYQLPGIPDVDKTMAVGVGLMLAALVLDRRRVLSFRLRWIDLPVLVLCLTPMLSSLANDRGIWSGLSGIFALLMRWGLPWILGRVYFADFKPQHQLALAIVVGALVYTPFCLFEMKTSPLLHEIVYGVKLKTIKHANRGLFWRPNVFMRHGLMCALYLGMSAFLAFSLWFTKARPKLLGFPVIVALGILVVVSIGASSKNALLMMGIGMACFVVARQLKWGFPVALVVLVPPVYIGMRQGAGWDGQELVDASAALFGEGRAGSLQMRFDSEAFLTDRANEKIWFGYHEMGEFTGNQTRIAEGGEDYMIIVDSMWLILLGTYGLFGLIGAFVVMLMPPLLLWRRLPPRYWTHPDLAPVAALAILSALFAIDCLLNSFDNPVFIAAGGGVCGLLGTREGRARWE